MPTPATANAGGAQSGDPSTISRSDRRTLVGLFAHPLAHNLAWSDVVALFNEIGHVEQKSNNEFVFHVGGKKHPMRKPHTDHLTTQEVMELRHFAVQVGWSPESSASPAQRPHQGPPDLLVTVEHHEARVYQIDVASDETADHVIRPYDPHHFLHHLTHKEQSRERGQRAHEDATFYDRIAQVVAAGGRIVLVGHGTGKSNASHHLAEYLRAHHPETYQRVVREVAVDLSAVTAPQLLDVGRSALR